MFTFAELVGVRLMVLFGPMVSLVLVAPLVGVSRSLLVCITDDKVVIQALFGDALAPTVAFYFLNVVFVLLTICETLVAVHLVFVVVMLLSVMVLLNCLVLLQSSGLLQTQLFVNPAASKLVQIFF